MPKTFICPMHRDVRANAPGKCPICGMNLEPKGYSEPKIENPKAKPKFSDYKPLFIIISLILTATVTIALSDYISLIFSFKNTMSYFMAGFFLVFAGFKLLDLKGFAQAYATYDLLASRFPKYGYLFPILEFILGLLYLNGITSLPIIVITFSLMGFSGFGVLNAMRSKRKFQCACLGTIIKLPLTYVTLIEDFGMAAMALVTLII